MKTKELFSELYSQSLYIDLIPIRKKSLTVMEKSYLKKSLEDVELILLINLAIDKLNQGHRVKFISLNSSKQDLFKKIISIFNAKRNEKNDQINFRNLSNPTFFETNKEKIKEISSEIYGLDLFCSSKIEVNELLNEMNGYEFIFIDGYENIVVPDSLVRLSIVKNIQRINLLCDFVNKNETSIVFSGNNFFNFKRQEIFSYKIDSIRSEVDSFFVLNLLPLVTPEIPVLLNFDKKNGYMF